MIVRRFIVLLLLLVDECLSLMWSQEIASAPKIKKETGGWIDGRPRIFFVIDTYVGGLQEASRATWLQSVKSAGHDYRFFLYDDKGLDQKSDMVIVPAKFRASERHLREFNLLKFALTWATGNAQWDYVVKVDHDFYVCVHHLESVLASAPRQKFFLGYFWDHMRCRADQDFLVYSRDVVQLAVAKFDALSSRAKNQDMNWASHWGMLAQHLFANGQLTVVDDRVRIDSQQGYHYTPTAVSFPADYCSRMLGMHTWPSETGVNASSVMERLWDLNSDQGLAGQPQLSSPSCYEQISDDCKENFETCN